MSVEPNACEPLYRCEPFTPGQGGYLHLWSFHDIKDPDPDPTRRGLLHEHRHANGLADHTHTDQPDTGVRA
jgi:hypothetical protein